MNRIEHCDQSSKQSSDSTDFSIESALFSPAAADTSCALFAPLHYEPNYPYPLIVWLHGPGKDDERQLMRVMPLISMRNYVAVAPRGFHSGDAGSSLESLDWPQTIDHIQEAERRVFDAVDTARKKCNVADRKIFLAGFSSGGTMAYRVAMNHPGKFAGVLSICGAFPHGHNPLSHLASARRLPVFLAVGRDSTEYSPAAACEDLRLFHTAGVSVALRQYPCGQQLAPQMLRDADRWIIEQVTSMSDPLSESGNLWSFSSD